MIEKSAYIISHYLLLFAFLFSCWGIGHYVLQRAQAGFKGDILLAYAFAITVGIGVFICAIQGLAIIGMLTLAWISVPFFAGIFLAIRQINTSPLTSFKSMQRRWRLMEKTEKGGLILIFLAVLAAVLDPLAPPLEWDEVMYHLPHAREWASSGKLQVNTWLRYPWFPYNFDLLFAAALAAYDDVMPHLIHAAAGWLTALMIYRAGKLYLNQGVAFLACIIWLAVTRKEFAYAYIDMGVTLFVFSACIAFHFWLEGAREKKWLGLTAFLLGVAVGSKYQALGFLPIFAFAILTRERRPASLMLPGILFLIPCIYWYARNAIFTGDPFNPIGAKLFGFHDWNLADYQYQFQALKVHAGWPHWLLWASLLSPLAKQYRKLYFAKSSMLFCCYSFIFWLATSQNPRYLMPAYPLMALLAGCTWHWIWQKSSTHFFANNSNNHKSSPNSKLFSGRSHARLQGIGWLVLILLASAYATKRLSKSSELVASNGTTREAILEERISGYHVLHYLRQHPFLKTYQFGLEDAIYYGPNPIWGDHFGPARYNDFASLEPAELAAKFRSLGFDSMVIHTERWPKIITRPEFDNYFVEVYRKDPVILYRIGTDREHHSAR